MKINEYPHLGLAPGEVKLARWSPTWRETAGRLLLKLSAEIKAGQFCADRVDLIHTGSTSIPGLDAKPVLDFLVTCHNRADYYTVAAALLRIGCLRGRQITAGTPEQVFHLVDDGRTVAQFHVMPADSAEAAATVRFKLALNISAETSTRYLILKTALAEKFPHDPAAYCAGKAAFVAHVLQQFKQGNPIP